MNRINELIEKATKHYPTTEGSGEFSTFDKEKFAELIIQECIETLINNTPARYTNESAEEEWDKGYDRAMDDCVHHIKDHFNIKT